MQAVTPISTREQARNIRAGRKTSATLELTFDAFDAPAEEDNGL